MKQPNEINCIALYCPNFAHFCLASPKNEIPKTKHKKKRKVQKPAVVYSCRVRAFPLLLYPLAMQIKSLYISNKSSDENIFPKVFGTIGFFTKNQKKYLPSAHFHKKCKINCSRNFREKTISWEPYLLSCRDIGTISRIYFPF